MTTTENKIQWFTTAPNPRSRSTGYDAGQRGWRLHAVMAGDHQKFSELRYGYPGLCGVRPRHGWSLDLFIDAKCVRCVKKTREMGYVVEID
jgi:hypothetical protein